MSELSPAAEAVMDAYWATPDEPLTTQVHQAAVASVLRAAADQVVPEEPEPSEQPFASFNDPWPSWNANQKARAELLAIAAELETFTTENR